MKIITVSREFGSGGRELGKRLADHLGFDYYDSEIITAVAQKCGQDPRYIEEAFSDHGWQDYPITFHRTIGSVGYAQTDKVAFLLSQKSVLEEIAALGKDCIIVGRNADMILRRCEPFNVFVCADTQAKVRRCMERAPEGEHLTEKGLIRKMKQIDRARAQTRDVLSGSPWGRCASYHLTVNTADWSIKELTPAVADYAMRWFDRTK